MSGTANKETLSKPPALAYLSLFLLGLMTAAGLRACRDYVSASNQRERMRITSPDRRVDAVLVQRIIGGTQGNLILYLLARGEPVSSYDEAAVAGDRFAQPPALIWKAPHLLEMRYSHGCIRGFSNVWRSEEVINGNYYVEVRLDPGSDFPCIGQHGADRSSATGLSGPAHGAGSGAFR